MSERVDAPVTNICPGWVIQSQLDSSKCVFLLTMHPHMSQVNTCVGSHFPALYENNSHMFFFFCLQRPNVLFLTVGPIVASTKGTFVFYTKREIPLGYIKRAEFKRRLK